MHAVSDRCQNRVYTQLKRRRARRCRAPTTDGQARSRKPGASYNRVGVCVATLRRKKNPGSSGGKQTRGGVQQRGGRRKIAPLVHLLHGHQANLAKLFISEKSFFPFAGTLGVPETRFAGEPGQLVLRNSQQHGGAALRDVLGNRIVQDRKSVV